MFGKFFIGLDQTDLMTAIRELAENKYNSLMEKIMNVSVSVQQLQASVAEQGQKLDAVFAALAVEAAQITEVLDANRLLIDQVQELSAMIAQGQADVAAVEAVLTDLQNNNSLLETISSNISNLVPDAPVEEPVIDEPVIDEPVIDEPVVDEPVIDEPVVEEPPTEEPVVDEPPTEEPVIDEPVVEEPVIDEPPTEEPVIDEPIVEEPPFPII
jgi:hypothetical protein